MARDPRLRQFEVAVRLGEVAPALACSHLERWLREDRIGVLDAEERDGPDGWDGELRLIVWAENEMGAVSLGALAVRNGMRSTGCIARRVAVATRGGPDGT